MPFEIFYSPPCGQPDGPPLVSATHASLSMPGANSVRYWYIEINSKKIALIDAKFGNAIHGTELAAD